MELVAEIGSAKVSRSGPAVRGLVAELLGELPANRRPAAGAAALQAALVWGDDHLVDLVELAPGVPLVVGKGDDATLQVAHELTFAGAVTLGALGPAGLVLTLPAAAEARVRTDGGDRSVVELLRDGRATPVRGSVDGVRVVLGLNERAVLRLGNLRLVVRQVRPSKTRFAWDLALASRLVVYALCLATGLACLRLTDWSPDEAWLESAYAAAPRFVPGAR